MIEVMLPDPDGGGLEGGFDGGLDPPQGFKSLKQVCPPGQFPLFEQGLTHPLLAASQFTPQRVVPTSAEGGGGGGLEGGGGGFEGGFPPQGFKSLKQDCPLGQFPLSLQACPQLAASQLAPQRCPDAAPPLLQGPF